MPDLRCNRSYKINFSHACSWIAINLCGKHQGKVLIGINWEVNPTEKKTNPGKEKPSSFRLEARGGLPGVGVQRGLGVLHTAAAVSLSLVSDLLCLGARALHMCF